MPPHAHTTPRALGAAPFLRSWLFDGCCLGAAVAGLALSLALGTCETSAPAQGTSDSASPPTLAPILQMRSQPLASCPRAGERANGASFTSVNPVR